MTTATAKQLMTFSRGDSFKSCRRKTWFAYEAGIRREVDAKALRMGTAYHSATEAIHNGKDFDDCIDAVRKHYQFCPASIDQHEWDIEQETVIRLVCGYHWRWEGSGVEFLAAEQGFELPMLNPETGKTSPVWNMAGKIDGIVRLQDERLAVFETKLLSDDISPDATMWPPLRRSWQVSIYVMAARRMGYEIDTVLYNVARKPTIKPTPVPTLDENRQKIVVDPATGERIYNKNGSPRQTGDTEKGYVILSRPMTSEEWGEKLTEDIAARPDFYYQRVEIARLEDDLAECSRELWDLQREYRNAQTQNRWYRTAGKQTCPWCAYDAICDRRDLTPDTPLPEGFVRVEDVHPELKGSTE